MTFTVEVVLKGRDHAVTERVSIAAADVELWTDADVQDLLTEVLRAIERAENPSAAADRTIALRGFSWIVEPSSDKDGVVVAIEIPMGAAVAGPFAISQAKLDAAISRVLRRDQSSAPATTVH